MKKLLLLLLIPLFNYSQTGIAVPEMSHCDTQIQNFMSTFNIPSASVAITKDGKLVYSRSFGNADIQETEPTQPYNMFRIASVSKPVTAIGIMKMVENGLLNLSDQVFGTGGVLENHWYFSQANIIDTRVYDITVQMLLEHTAGWDRNVNCFPNPTSPYPWFFGGCDPIIAPLHVTQTFGESNPVKEEHLIRYVLEKNLNHDPGTTYAYSNMGFLVLSEIIEEISGQDYETWMREQVFNSIGVYDMYIGKNKLEDKQEREGEYVGNGYTTLDLYGSGTNVPWEYQGFSIEAMDGHGGWIATARDLARLLVAVDGFNTKPDILQPTSITTMSTPSTAFQYYAKGWQVNSVDNWWHSGAVDGTASYWVRTNSGYTWAIILNKRIVDGNSNAFWGQLDALGWNCINNTTTYPTHDLFESPTINASSLQISNIEEESFDLSWTNGNGNNRIVVIKELPENAVESNFENYPIDGTDYISNNTFGLGDDLGNNTYIVYNGTGTSVSIDGLTEGTQYAIRVYEYTKNTINGNNALYLLGNPDEQIVQTETLGLQENELSSMLKVYPTVSSNAINLTTKNSSLELKISVYDILGKKLITNTFNNNFNYKLDIESLTNGVYVLNVKSNLGEKTYRFIKKK